MKIVLTQHAKYKIALLEKYGFITTEDEVISTISNPDSIYEQERIFIAQKAVSERHLLRVVYKQEKDIVVITLYPARRDRYE